MGRGPRRRPRSMRSKEEAHDYRYFPEPDLLPLAHRRRPGWTRSRAALPELPRARRQRFASQLRAARLRRRRADAERARSPTTTRRPWRDYPQPQDRLELGDVRAAPGDPRRRRAAIARALMPPGQLAGLLRARGERDHQRQDRQGRLRDDVALGRGCGRPSFIARGSPRSRDRPSWPARGAASSRDNPGRVEDYRKGKAAAAKALVGQVMKATRRQGEPGAGEPARARKSSLEIQDPAGYNRARRYDRAAPRVQGLSRSAPWNVPP